MQVNRSYATLRNCNETWCGAVCKLCSVARQIRLGVLSSTRWMRACKRRDEDFRCGSKETNPQSLEILGSKDLRLRLDQRETLGLKSVAHKTA